MRWMGGKWMLPWCKERTRRLLSVSGARNRNRDNHVRKILSPMFGHTKTEESCG